MNKRRLQLIIGFVCLTAVFLVAQPLPSTLPLASQEHQPRGRNEIQGMSWVFNLKGKKYAAQIPSEAIIAGPEWTPATPLPLAFDKAVQVARGELRKIAGDDSKWEITEINLRHLGDENENKWFYVLKLMLKAQDRAVIPDSFVVPVSLSGEPGRIVRYGQ